MLHPRAVAAKVATGALLDVMRASLRAHGPNQGLLEVLRAVGFTWAPPPGADELDLDVARVAEALAADVRTPAVPPPDSRHGAGEPGAGPALRRGRQTAPVTNGGAAGVLRRRESAAHRAEREFYGDVLGED